MAGRIGSGEVEPGTLVDLLRDAAVAVGQGSMDAALAARLRAAILALDPAAGRPVARVDVLERWRGGLWKQGGGLEVEMETLRRRIRVLGREVRDRGDGARPGTVDALDRARALLDAAEARMRRVERLLSMRRDELAADLLPLGTPVRIREETFAHLDAPGPLPAAGALGVVVSYRSPTDRPMAVAFGRPVPDREGGTLAFEPRSPRTFDVSLADVDVAGPAMLVGFGENGSLGYVATHLRDDGRDEMLLDADGVVWRVRDAGADGPVPAGTCAREEDLPRLSRIGKTRSPGPGDVEPRVGEVGPRLR